MQSAHMDSKLDVTDRLRSLRNQAGLSVREMAHLLDMSSSGYSHYENPKRFKSQYLPMDIARRVADVLRPHGVPEVEVMNMALDVMDDYNELVRLEEAEGHLKSLVPVYDVTASAGNGAHVDHIENVAYSLAFPREYLQSLTKSHPKNLAIISVKGDSMAPTLHDDDIVMLDASKTNLSYDGLFVVRFWDALHVKRISRGATPDTVMIISDNRDYYPPQQLPIDEVTVVGKVIWTGGKV